MKLLKCKTSINKTLFSVEKLFVTMFVIFSLVKKKILKKYYLKKFGIKKINYNKYLVCEN